jgi:hypothetical protein
VKHGVQRPSIGLPSVFGKIANLQKDYYSQMQAEAFCNELPPGAVKYGANWVQSEVINFPSGSGCYIRGRFDIVVEFDAGGYGVIDFKAREPGEEPTVMFDRQLHAYAHALENAAPGELRLCPVTRLGLLYFGPSAVELKGARQYVSGPLTYWRRSR